jgi:NAD(P)-dependent dehydrogenase (short-subunit alcohol dehydrogenase family)
LDLNGKVALMTGAKRIGVTIAAELAARGVNLAISYSRSRTEAEQAGEQARTTGVSATVIQADLSSPAACRHLVGVVAERLGRLDILINMASLYTERPFADLTVEDWNRAMEVDLRAAFLCSHAAVPFMRAQGGGRIVNFSDWVARSGRPRYRGFVPYYVAKAGVIALTESLALELADDNILVNAIAPGPILAPPDVTEEQKQDVARATPLGRWGGAGEIAKAVLALLDSDFITGETIRVDGGRHVK